MYNTIQLGIIGHNQLIGTNIHTVFILFLLLLSVPTYKFLQVTTKKNTRTGGTKIMYKHNNTLLGIQLHKLGNSWLLKMFFFIFVFSLLSFFYRFQFFYILFFLAFVFNIFFILSSFLFSYLFFSFLFRLSFPTQQYFFQIPLKLEMYNES